MIYRKFVLRMDKGKVTEIVEDVLNELSIKYIRHPVDARFSIYLGKEKWRPFAFFLGVGSKAPPNSPNIDIVIVEGFGGVTEVIFRILEGFEKMAMNIWGKIRERVGE